MAIRILRLTFEYRTIAGSVSMAMKPAVPARGGDAFTEATSNAGAGCACAAIAVIPGRRIAKPAVLIAFIQGFDIGVLSSNNDTYLKVQPIHMLPDEIVPPLAP